MHFLFPGVDFLLERSGRLLLFVRTGSSRLHSERRESIPRRSREEYLGISWSSGRGVLERGFDVAPDILEPTSNGFSFGLILAMSDFKGSGNLAYLSWRELREVRLHVALILWSLKNFNFFHNKFT